MPYRPIVLAILDGWGLSPSWGGNAISLQNPPFINYLWKNFPHTILQAFSLLPNPYQKVGNSEIGHASIGAGKMINQDLVEISFAIQDLSFFKNNVLLTNFERIKKAGKKIHLVGMLSDGAVHSHLDHLFALLELAKKVGTTNVYLHIILDGQDSPPTSALSFQDQLEKKIKETGIGEIATISGRFYAMDRDNHWDRTALAYQAMVMGTGVKVKEAKSAISEAYRKGYTDWNFPPAVIFKNNKPPSTISDGDCVVFFNARADRMRQLVRAFTDKEAFRELRFFRRFPLINALFITLTDYHLKDLPVLIAFPPAIIKDNLAAILSKNDLKQLHVAETEKYAHVTYFLNGGIEEPYRDEDRIIIPSPRTDGFDKTPAMKAREITEAIIKKLKRYDFIVINYSNVDLLSHTGNIVATAKAVEIIDQEIKKLATATAKIGGLLIITADHGNAEQMIHLKETKEPETLHTLNPVPLIFVANDLKRSLLETVPISPFNMLADIMKSKNTLADIAPTILELFSLPIPKSMEGKSLALLLKSYAKPSGSR